MKKTYSGRFVLRLSPVLHRQLNSIARLHKQSLNTTCFDLLSRAVAEGEGSRRPKAAERYSWLVKILRDRFGPELLGLLVFGSTVTKEATASSDVDFLIVLPENRPLERSLYTWWEEAIAGRDDGSFSPHFVHLPPQSEEAGGLWFEAALNHEIISENGSAVSKFLAKLGEMVESGRIRRHWTNGQPYWVWHSPARLNPGREETGAAEEKR